MKHFIYAITAAALCAAALVSCNEEALNINRTDAFSDVAIWSSESNADLYITGAYCTFRDVSNVANMQYCFYDAMTDLFKDTGWYAHDNSFNIALLLDTGFTDNGAGLLECWGTCYNRIRINNVMLTEIDSYGEKFGEEWCNIRKAEVRFCRAYNYWRLARVYGGVCLRTETSGKKGGLSDGDVAEDIPMARATEKETYDFILSDLEYAAENLPESWSSKWLTRATKLSAYAMISRMALYAEEWQKAIDAADMCAELGASLAPDYAKLFDSSSSQDNRCEVLFELDYLKGSLTHQYDKRMRSMGDMSKYGTECYAYYCPTKELVDMYEWSDGKAFDWNTWSTNHSDPYTDREPRFHATVLYHGASWDGRKIDVTSTGLDKFSEFVTQTGNVQGYTCTGYYPRKYIQVSNSTFGTEYSDQTDNVIRYAEVLLNKAEACAQLNDMTSALKALNEVRARVSLPKKTTSDAPSVEKFMEVLRHERCVELAGEGLRYWDLRRWKLAQSVIDGQSVHGTKVTKSAGKYNYETVDADGGATRIFPEKYYYFAIPSDEISNNSKIDQNNGW